VELSSPLTATVGAHALTAVINYTAELLQPGVRDGVRPGVDTEPGTGPALTLVPASGTGEGFESGATGRVGVLVDSSADLAATATARPAAGADGWTLNLTVVNHGPAAVYATGNETDNEYVAEVDVILPRHTVATDYEHAEAEDSAYGPCFLWVSDTTTAPFEAGHRHYVCVVPFGIGAGKNVESLLSVKPDKSYDGGKGRATLRPGPAGIALHDPNSANDHVTFAFSTSTAPSGDTMADTGADRTALMAAGATGAVLLGAAALVVHRRRRRSP
jgi:LPXTG-motif cell wall-anchored protein